MIVHPFKRIDVDHDQAAPPAEQRTEVDLALKLLVETGAVVDQGHRVDRGLSAHAVEFLAEALESGGHLTQLSALTAAPVGQKIRCQRERLLGLALDLGRVTVRTALSGR